MGNKLRSSGKHGSEKLKYATHIDNKHTWDSLEHTPTDRVFSHCGVVKFVVDLTSNPDKPKPHFIHSKVRQNQTRSPRTQAKIKDLFFERCRALPIWPLYGFKARQPPSDPYFSSL